MRLVAFFLCTVAASYGQDTRNVQEPSIPASCAQLKAVLTMKDGGSLSAADETRLDTARIQHALDTCTAGRAVVLQPDGGATAFLSGPLQLRAGVALVVDRGAMLLASRDASVYEVSPGSCGKVDDSGRGCKPLIGGDHVTGAAVMGDGVIDGRGGAALLGKNVTWWDLAEQARPGNRHQNVPRILVLNHADNFTLYRITLRNSPNFHVIYNGNGFTAWGVTVDSPKNARNTDGIDPSSATNVTITRCFIHAGDDHVAIKAGNNGPSSHITIAHNHFYTGHGVSIGSETNGGVSAVRVTDLSIDGADNGIRIKSNSSRGGIVKDIVYEDVCIRNTKNPILMDSNYAFYGSQRDLIPHFTDIVLKDVFVLTAGKVTLDGSDENHRLGIALDHVVLQEPAASKISATHADVRLGSGVNLMPTGDDVHVTGQPGPASRGACQEKFVPMPAAAR